MSTLMANSSITHWGFYKSERRSYSSSDTSQLFLGLLAEVPVVMLTFALWTHVHKEMDREVSNSFPGGSQTAITCEGQ